MNSYRLLPAFLLIAASALAQEPDVKECASRLAPFCLDLTGPVEHDRPIDIGIAFGSVGSTVWSGRDIRITASVPSSGHRSIEGFMVITSPDAASRDASVFDRRAYYGFQVKHGIGRRFEGFSTAGLMGMVARMWLPFIPTVGVGAQYAVTPHVAVRLDAQLFVVPVVRGGRFSGGVSIPIGRY